MLNQISFIEQLENSQLYNSPNASVFTVPDEPFYLVGSGATAQLKFGFGVDITEDGASSSSLIENSLLSPVAPILQQYYASGEPPTAALVQSLNSATPNIGVFTNYFTIAQNLLDQNIQPIFDILAADLGQGIFNLFLANNQLGYYATQILYNHAGGAFLTSTVIADLQNQNYVGAAYQIIFEPPSGMDASYLNAAVNAGALLLGFVPTLNSQGEMSALGTSNLTSSQTVIDFLNLISTGKPSTVTASVVEGLLSNLNPYLATLGYYIPQPDDTTASIAARHSITTTALTAINAIYADSSFAVGGLVHVPVASQTVTATSVELAQLPANENYVFDADTNTVYTVGGALNGSASGSLIIDSASQTNQTYPTFAQGTYSAIGLVDGSVAVSLSTPSGVVLGNYLLNKVLTLSDGTVLSLPTLTNLAIANNLSSTATPEQYLLSYLAQLGDSLTGAQLDQLNQAFQHPTGTSYVLQGTSGNNGLSFSDLSGAPGAVIAGAAGKTGNILSATGDLTEDTISDVQILDVIGNVAVTLAQFNAFSTIEGTGDLTISSSGTVTATTSKIQTNVALSAGDWNGTKLIGDAQNGQVLTASLFGNDTLNAGSGTGDVLVAGEGVDTLTGGIGGDTFEANNGLAAGSKLTGGSGANIMEANGDISQASISGIQTLQLAANSEVVLNSAQLSAFTTITAVGYNTLLASSGGQYSLAEANVVGELTLATDKVDATTLTGNGANLQTLSSAGSSAVDDLNAGNGDYDTLDADDTTNSQTLSAGSGIYDVVTAQNSFGADTLSVENGNYDTINADNSNGNDHLTAGNGNQDKLYADSTSGFDWLTAGDGEGDILTLSGSSNSTPDGGYLQAGNGEGDILESVGGVGGTMVAGNGASDSLYGDDTTGDNQYTLGDGDGDVITISDATGDNTIQVGNGNNDVLVATATAGNNELIAGNGNSDTLSAGDSSGNNEFIIGNGSDVVVSGGVGNNFIEINNGIGADDYIECYGSNNVLEIDGVGADLTGTTIMDVQLLLIADSATVKITAAEAAAFTTYETSAGGTPTLELADAGSYDFAQQPIYDNLIVSAADLTSGNVNIIGADGDGQNIIGEIGTGANTITTGTGNGDIVTTGGIGDVVNFYSVSGTVTTTGANAWINANADNEVVDAGGASNTVQGNADSQWINANGAGNTVTVAGNNDTVVANGTNIWVNLNGTGDECTTNNTNDNINVNGANSWVNADGNDDSVTLSSADDSINVNGANTWVNLNGTGDAITLSSTGDSINANSNDNWLNINGNSDSVTLSGSGDTLNINGASVWNNVNGNDNTATASGANATINLNGDDNWINLFGSNGYVFGAGTGNVINIGASGNTADLSGDNIIIADGLSDTINGGGNNQYELGSTFGAITINNDANNDLTSANGQIEFASGVSDQNLWFTKTGNNLVIDLLGTADTVTVDNWFGTEAGAQTQEITADGLKLDTQVASLVSAMAAYSASSGFNPETAASMPTNTPLQNAIAASWHS